MTCECFQIKTFSFCRILQHFGVSAEDYHVVFTGGATAALQMVAQNFCFNNQRHNNEKTDSDVGGGFFYLLDNHTSVLGMRAVVSSRGHRSECVTRDEVESWMSSPSALSHHHGNSLFAFPAQSNFSGQKYPLSWVAMVGRSWLERTSKCYVLLDAAAFVATSPLDLRRYHPDFVSVSFYKMFGFPTGLGNNVVLINLNINLIFDMMIVLLKKLSVLIPNISANLLSFHQRTNITHWCLHLSTKLVT